MRKLITTICVWIIAKLLRYTGNVWYNQSVRYLIGGREARHEAIPIETWNLVAVRLREALNDAIQAARAGNDRLASRALIAIELDFKLLDAYVMDWQRRKQSGSKVKEQR